MSDRETIIVAKIRQNMEHVPHAFTLGFLVKLAEPVGLCKRTPLSWLCVWPCNTDVPQ